MQLTLSRFALCTYAFFSSSVWHFFGAMCIREKERDGVFISPGRPRHQFISSPPLSRIAAEQVRAFSLVEGSKKKRFQPLFKGGPEPSKQIIQKQSCELGL